MKPGDRLEGKLDPGLRAALLANPEDAVVRVVANLRRSAPFPTADGPQSGDRSAIRAARIATMRATGAALHGAFVERARTLGVSVGGGELSGAVVVEGRAADVEMLLDSEDVTSAILDRSIDLIEPVRRSGRAPE